MKKRITFSILLFTLILGFTFTTAHADDEDIPGPTFVTPTI
jgi:hypothetical protein